MEAEVMGAQFESPPPPDATDPKGHILKPIVDELRADALRTGFQTTPTGSRQLSEAFPSPDSLLSPRMSLLEQPENYPEGAITNHIEVGNLFPNYNGPEDPDKDPRPAAWDYLNRKECLHGVIDGGDIESDVKRLNEYDPNLV